MNLGLGGEKKKEIKMISFQVPWDKMNVDITQTSWVVISDHNYGNHNHPNSNVGQKKTVWQPDKLEGRQRQKQQKVSRCFIIVK